MPKPPLPRTAVAMLRKPSPAVNTTPRQDGQPVYLLPEQCLKPVDLPGRA